MKRLAAVASLVLLALSSMGAVVLVVESFPEGLAIIAAAVLAAAIGWYSLRRRGFARVAGLIAALILFALAVVLTLVEGRPLVGGLVLAGFVLASGAATEAFRIKVELPAAAAPSNPVLFYNPKSGGGKAERFNLAAEAPARGIRAVELKRGEDLRQLVEASVDDGADGLAMAGGDGSQAIVAAIAAERGLPYACIPAGTRNHFALDLGVDRDDVVGALDAFVDGGERRVDLAEVNGRVFVNNVSLGIYAEAVQREEYRDAKVRTLLQTMGEVLGPDEAVEPGVTLVSNNRYRFGGMASGTRPRLDQGRLGVASLDGEGRFIQQTMRSHELEGEGQVAAGIDGEAVMLDLPVRFRMLPGALRVRIARRHPGASPSARIPDRGRDVVPALLRIAVSG